MVMSFRETNEVLWRGVRPAHNGTQVAKSELANDSTEIIHTVSAGVVLYLCTLTMNIRNVAGRGEVVVRNDADINQYIPFRGEILTAAGVSIPASATFWPPLEVPAGWDIVVISTAANCWVEGFIFGWEE